MKAWWIGVVLCAMVVPGGLVLLAIAWWRHRRLARDDGQYVARINAWYAKDPPIRPLDLPAVHQLKAQRVEERLRLVK